MPPNNRASWLESKQAPVNVVDSAPYTRPSANELVIKTKAVAINPADVAVQKLGIIVEDFPAILGCDVAGEVTEVHPSLADTYHVGDRVLGAASCFHRKDGIYYNSAFQEYVVLRMPSIAPIPKNVAYEDAVVLPLAVNTSATCLFAEATLGLKSPSVEGVQAGQGKTLLVWGASSSVGSCGVQLASQAGYEVIGVASKKNHDMVKDAGAKSCFDHSDPKVVGDIVAYLKGKDLVGAFDAISTDPTLSSLCEILDKSGGGKTIVGVMPGIEEKATKGVKIVNNMSTFMSSGDILKTVWEWLAKAMEEKQVKYLPRSEVVGKGLEDVQKAVDLLAKGVSAKKLVVTI